MDLFSSIGFYLIRGTVGFYMNLCQRNLEKLDDIKTNSQRLKEILIAGLNTKYGIDNNFDSIIKGGKNNLPLTTYADYLDAIENLTDTDGLKHFILTTGTTGIPKKIPVYEGFNWSGMPGWELVLYHTFPKEYFGKRLMPFHITERQMHGGYKVRNALTTQLDKISDSFISSRLITRVSTSPLDVFLTDDHQLATFLHLYYALLDVNLWCVMTYFSKSTYHLFRYMEKNWSLLLSRVKITDKDRFDTLTKISTTEPGFVRKIWPNLKVLVCGASGYFKFYLHHLKHYIGDLPILTIMYASSEGVFGYPLKVNVDEYKLYPMDCSYEFIEFIEPIRRITMSSGTSSKSKEEKLIPIDQLVEGNIYELVITTFGRFYRYRTGDLIKFIRYEKYLPIITYVQRVADFITIGEDKVAVSVLALEEELMKISEGKMIDYLFQINDGNETNETNKPKYTLYVEAEAEVSDIFNSWCEKNNFNSFHVKRDTFMRLAEKLAGRTSLPDQVKIPRVIRNHKLILDFLIENKKYDEKIEN